VTLFLSETTGLSILVYLLQPVDRQSSLTIARVQPKVTDNFVRLQEAAVNTRDRDFRPPRRRSFDDDNYERPTRNFGYAPPTGPRFETPSGPSVRAVVKWYNPDKGFGFVTLADGSGDAFLHVSVVERSGQGSLSPGATLEVRAGPGPKGPQVTEIISVDASTASQEPPRRARPERPAPPPTDRATVEELGTVKWYNATKGFGFIAPDHGGKDIFVHASALERAGIMGLAEGQRVAVDVADGQKGPEAVSLWPI
jgi:CspA family cold shock protein